ncbi:unnamed protein product [Arctia plantaginis]|uniref:Uncharacterized protein n=1 Tax=Arctia plantaginis TaxID=874455 RepID=A0A8S0Z399_ARCPL|nr:unnamed protein product [Arctia plantaginis]
MSCIYYCAPIFYSINESVRRGSGLERISIFNYSGRWVVAAVLGIRQKNLHSLTKKQTQMMKIYLYLE